MSHYSIQGPSLQGVGVPSQVDVQILQLTATLFPCAMSSGASVMLDIHRVSPVRGQLELYDPRTPKGCRYIQCTETPSELKVLLPPGTAAMYEQLLKLEHYEVSKKPGVSWDRLMEIRHLKDRMIRKCQKLAKTTVPVSKKPSRGDTFSFQTFVAPSDFRCKDMEKWFIKQQKRTPPVPRRTITAPGYGIIQEFTLTGESRPAKANQSLQRSITNPEPSSKPGQSISYHSLILPTATSPPIPVPAGLNQVMSPPPLPVLLLSEREALGFDDPEPTTWPLPMVFDQPDALPVPPLIEEDGATPRPTCSRRTSCIKRNSVADMKTVSWADNHDIDAQLSQYESAAREAQASGKWEEVRKLYLEQISGLEGLHAKVREGLEHLRTETTHLQRVEDTIRRQREVLDVGFHEFEQKHALFQEKVQEALTEANDVYDAFTKHGPTRELQPING